MNIPAALFKKTYPRTLADLQPFLRIPPLVCMAVETLSTKRCPDLDAKHAEATAQEAAINEKSLQPAQTTTTNPAAVGNLPSGCSTAVKTASAADSPCKCF